MGAAAGKEKQAGSIGLSYKSICFISEENKRSMKNRRMVHMPPSVILPIIAVRPFCTCASMVLNHRSMCIKLK
jgi:hypothetical protein